MKRRALVPLLIYLVAALVYVSLLGQRALGPTPDNHYVHLAQSFLSGELGVLGNTPPGTNDWAFYNGRWFVSFPPFPALVIAPVVAIWGLDTRDGLFWALLAGLAPTLLFINLRRLSELGQSTRGLRDNLALTALFAFGTVFFFVSVQGTVWFAASVVTSILLMGFLWASFDARVPWLAGLMLGLLATTRPPGTPVAGLFFTVEALRHYRRAGPEASEDGSPATHPLARAYRWLKGAELGPVLKAHAIVALPVLLIVGLQMWLNYARFDDPFSPGHEYLQIRWRQRIDEWGLFNLHYFSKNLAVFTASLPWLYDRPPYVKISLHGLALWFTTPALFWTLWPKRWDARMVGLWLAILPIAFIDLCYQNSGWLQFGYRFALDYMPMLIVLLALGQRRFGPGFYACLAFAVVVNTFGALTFDRAPRYYDNDGTQNRLFQPD
ncbi:MAG: hypothetical protein JWN48_3141 [Myxococcaceae bacterium]|nr:hypothetical protein [Myxococcaceae bacterium]